MFFYMYYTTEIDFAQEKSILNDENGNILPLKSN